MKQISFLLLVVVAFASNAKEQAGQIFEQLAPALYQIKIIERVSGEKTTIGSAFQITNEGLIATNYHVVSGYARHPEKYKMEFLDNDGNKGELSLESVDVINDLALVKKLIHQPNDNPVFEIAKLAPTKGEKLFSLGNPHDLGMIVVPGTYNGLLPDSFTDKIHFTGSINSGMSGGPVVNADSKVVGINVATSGNSIGFLIPHDKLQALYNAYVIAPPTDITHQIAEQLKVYQAELIEEVLASQWLQKPLGQGSIPTIDAPFIRCWGDSNADKESALLLSALASCSLEDNTYIENNFFTGHLVMEYRYLAAKNISDTKFYHLYNQKLHNARAYNKVQKDDVTEFSCQHDIISPENQSIIQKAVFCARAYKDFPNLYDVVYLAASVDKNQQALISNFSLSGVKQDSAMAFMKKFIEAVTWQ
ncbi:trypsin-like peptidase domain-containing protein [Thalassotalea sp. LPB0316]|uniref:S1 family peptidase n=1 Tax=Thalassotalea sp. LPB0316 TaxID=2769490 RepID=UPI00186825CC|nr:serine protease [Thalassotalea sp. LPB0316]QOL26165.1 trypsin-like peptidase domain-containing protein [Thalassotalea sp. LPB0316]